MTSDGTGSEHLDQIGRLVAGEHRVDALVHDLFDPWPHGLHAPHRELGDQHASLRGVLGRVAADQRPAEGHGLP
jgi:hypothetical protein